MLIALGAGAARAASVGEVEINERVFDIPGEAELSVDDDPVTIEQLHERVEKGEGWRSDDLVANADASLATGSITALKLENNLKGPVTSADPLRVLGQPFTINGNTALVRIADPALIAPGDLLEVSGFVDLDSSLIAARVAADDSLTQWRVSGFLTALDLGAGTATIGSAPGGQAIAFSGVAPTGCAGGLALGDYVVAVATPIAGFVPGQTVDTVTTLRCSGVVPQAEDGEHDAFEGLVQSVPNETTFVVGGYTVTTDASTLFRNGNALDVDVGVRVEVEGTFTSPTAITARRVKFILPSLRWRVPVVPADVAPGISITVLGIPVLDNLQARDEDGILANGLDAESEVEVRAYLDKAGGVFATRVRSRGSPAPNDYRFQAPLSAIDGTTLTALGITIDTSGAKFFDETQNEITSTQFFSAITVGTLVEVEKATWDAASTTLTPDEVHLSDDGSAAVLHAPTAPVPSAKIGGALTRLTVDKVFANGFE